MRILFVDDEMMIRESMRGIIDWERVGCSELVLAESAAKAIDILQKEDFDLVISDIFMQRMNGVELSKYIRLHYPRTKVIILSAYEDFGMARGAIEAGVTQYLLKPVAPQELETAIMKATEEIKAGDELRSNIIETEKMVDLYRPVVAQSVWKMLLEQKSPDDDKTESLLELLGLRHLRDKLLCLLLFCQANISSEERDALEHNALELLPTALACVRMEDGDGVAVVLTETDHEAILNTHHELTARMHQKVGMSLGCAVENARRLRDSYMDAQKKKLIHTLMWQRMGDALGDCAQENALPPELDKMLLGIRVSLAYNRKGLRKKLEQYLRLSKEHGSDQKDRYSYEGKLLAELYLLMGELGAELPPYAQFVDRFEDGGELRLNDLTTWLQTAITQGDERGGGHETLTESVKRYINENFYDPELAVNSIAKAFHISNAYLSRVFRKECGITCIEYITAARLRYAKMLLENTDIRHGEIALKSGYSSVYYFGIQFKKIVGETPGEYRRRVRTEE